jgi:peptidoglycan/LPS O-acetylase OafA/YrhL
MREMLGKVPGAWGRRESHASYTLGSPMKPTTVALPSKSHYQILDGLRGVAAMMVVAFHTFEAYADENRFKQIINHGYLAVDFFFLLSGFVIAYAYDDRWGKMTQWEFYKRRLIRLQPMVVMGSIIGALLFYKQAAPIFPLIAHTPVWKMLLVMLIGMTMIPLTPAQDIRGWDEMHPLNGPAWSLFFEYVANIAYAAGLRKLSNKALGVLVALSGVFLVQYLLMGPRGDVIGGWAVDAKQLHIGFARLLFPFFGGILLMRLGWRLRVPQAFLVCSVLLVLTLAIPRFGGPQTLWMNGLYESVAILVIFPLIVAMGAGDTVHSALTLRLSKFFGELSYPLYITHYPLIYWYTAWVTKDHVPAARGAVFGVLLMVAACTIAYACLKLYDEPVRDWLKRRYLDKRG